jgi:uncharacterized protein (DUF2267 family)
MPVLVGDPTGNGDGRLPAAATSYQRQYPTENGAIISLSSVDAIERTVHKMNEWHEELAQERAIEDLEDARAILNSYLQLLRDQLTVDEGARLPIILRGAFYEGFDRGHPPRRRVTPSPSSTCSRRVRVPDEVARATEGGAADQRAYGPVASSGPAAEGPIGSGLVTMNRAPWSTSRIAWVMRSKP